MDFTEFETKYFDKLTNNTWGIIRDYYYPYKFWIDHNFGLSKTCITFLLKAVKAKWNNKWILEQIKCVEKRYKILSNFTLDCKYELTGISNFDSANNAKLNMAGQKTQQY